jgi:hypothetical protein
LQRHSEMNNAITESLLKNSQEIARIIRDGQEKNVFRPVDVELTISTLFGTVFHLVSSSSLAAKLMNLEHSTEMLENPAIKTRLKNHLKDLMHAHLKI